MKSTAEQHEDYIKELTSDFNEAKFQIYRLHILWVTCNNLSNEGKLQEWKWKLDTIWRELSPDAQYKDKNKEIPNTYFYKVELLNKKIAETKEREELYNVLQEKEIFLRCLQDEVGKGSKKSSTEIEDFDE
jgi:hypothetical protein